MESNFIELQALLTEREGMLAANIEREHRGESLAYIESDFTVLSKNIRALKTAESPATAGNIDYTAALTSELCHYLNEAGVFWIETTVNKLATRLNAAIRKQHCV